jgi:hypothetical protein
MLLPGIINDGVLQRPISTQGPGKRGGATIGSIGARESQGIGPIIAPSQTWDPWSRVVETKGIIPGPARTKGIIPGSARPARDFTPGDGVYITILDQNSVGIVLFP